MLGLIAVLFGTWVGVLMYILDSESEEKHINAAIWNAMVIVAFSIIAYIGLWI